MICLLMPPSHHLNNVDSKFLVSIGVISQKMYQMWCKNHHLKLNFEDFFVSARDNDLDQYYFCFCCTRQLRKNRIYPVGSYHVIMNLYSYITTYEHHHKFKQCLTNYMLFFRWLHNNQSTLNPLRAIFFRENINIYLHFMSFLHTG